MTLWLRLALSISAVLVVTSLVTGTTEYGIVRNGALAAADRMLVLRAATLVPQLQALAAGHNLTAATLKPLRINLSPLDSLDADLFVQIDGPDGAVLLTSDNLEGRRLTVAPTEDTQHFETRALASGSEVRLLICNVRGTAGNARIGTLVVGESLDLVNATVSSAGHTLLWIRMFELALMLAVTGLVLHRALLPLRRVVRTAESIIESGDVSQRVEGANATDSVGRFAGSFNAVLAKVESLLQAQKRMLADTSHELRNPLTVVRTNVDFLGKPLDPDMRAEVTQETEREVVRMIALVEDLMLLSKVESTRHLRMEPVRLDRLAREAVERMAPIAGGRTLELKDGPEPVVLGDEDRLRQIFTNLIGNAIRYTDASGHITVRVEMRTAPPQQGAAGPIGYGVIGVSDDGVGIAEPHLPHVFERFYRVDSNRSRSTGGTGLGLAIVKALVDAHGGFIEVTSRVGEGSTFTVFIPLEDSLRPRVTNLMPVVQD